MSVTGRIASGFKARFLASTLSVLANGLLILALTRVLLDPDEYGLVFLALSIFSVARLLADLGLANSGARYIAEYKHTDAGQVPYIIAAVLRYRLLLLALVGGGVALASPVISETLGEPALTPLLVIGVGFLLFESLAGFCSNTFQGFNRVEYSAAIEAVASVARVVFVVGFVVVVADRTVGAMIGYVVAAGFGAAVGLFYLYTRFYAPAERAPAVEDGLVGRVLRYAVPLTASQAANVLDKQVDTVFVGFFAGPTAVAFYTLGKQVSEFVSVPVDSLGFAISPTYGEEKAGGSLDRAARIYETSLQYTLLLYVPAAAGLVIVAEPTIRFVFGTDYLGAVPVLQVLSVYIVLQGVVAITTQALDYLGRARVRAIAKGVTSVANAVLNVLLIPPFGVTGAAVATVITFSVYTVANVYIIYRELDLAFDRLFRILAGVGVITVAMALPVLLVMPYVSTLVTLAGVVVLGGAIWAVLATASGLLDVRRVISLLR